jgi:MYXO-CTERM domain-containing protein
VADFARPEKQGVTSRISSSKAQLACLRADTINEGSFEPDLLPSPTPVAYNVSSTPAPEPDPTGSLVEGQRSSSELEGGAVAGIVVGSIAIAALAVGGLVFLCFRRRRRSLRIAARRAVDPDAGGLVGVKAELSADSTNPTSRTGRGKFMELGVDGQTHELDASFEKFQLPATVEEGGRLGPMELMGDKKEEYERGLAELP